VKAASSNSLSFLPFSKVHWFFDRAQKSRILSAIVILVGIFGTIVVILVVTSGWRLQCYAFTILFD